LFLLNLSLQPQLCKKLLLLSINAQGKQVPRFPPQKRRFRISWRVKLLISTLLRYVCRLVLHAQYSSVAAPRHLLQSLPVKKARHDSCGASLRIDMFLFFFFLCSTPRFIPFYFLHLDVSNTPAPCRQKAVGFNSTFAPSHLDTS
jgi:hypothetical protein